MVQPTSSGISRLGVGSDETPDFGIPVEFGSAGECAAAEIFKEVWFVEQTEKRIAEAAGAGCEVEEWDFEAAAGIDRDAHAAGVVADDWDSEAECFDDDVGCAFFDGGVDENVA